MTSTDLDVPVNTTSKVLSRKAVRVHSLSLEIIQDIGNIAVGRSPTP